MTLRDPETGSWYKYDVEKATPKWPVIQPAAPVKVEVSEIPPKPARNGLKMSLKCGDTQIGFRVLEVGTTEEFHDKRAMDLVVEVARRVQPDSIVILGDFLYLPSHCRWAHDEALAMSNKMSLDTVY